MFFCHVYCPLFLSALISCFPILLLGIFCCTYHILQFLLSQYVFNEFAIFFSYSQLLSCILRKSQYPIRYTYKSDGFHHIKQWILHRVMKIIDYTYKSWKNGGVITKEMIIYGENTENPMCHPYNNRCKSKKNIHYG